MVFDRPVKILQRNELGEFVVVAKLHAAINKKRGDSYDDGNSERFRYTLNFDFRYNKLLKEIAVDAESYRLEYNDCVFAITDYDDFMEQHRTVRIVGESLGI